VAAGDLKALLAGNATLETTKLLALSANISLLTDLLDKLGQRYPTDELYLTRSVEYLSKLPTPWPTREPLCNSWLKICST
jgi:hypothetical protein